MGRYNNQLASEVFFKKWSLVVEICGKRNKRSKTKETDQVNAMISSSPLDICSGSLLNVRSSFRTLVKKNDSYASIRQNRRINEVFQT
jgi:hypothetical protein